MGPGAKTVLVCGRVGGRVGGWAELPIRRDQDAALISKAVPNDELLKRASSEAPIRPNPGRIGDIRPKSAPGGELGRVDVPKTGP